ncbi:MAG: alpha/beta fold hydrolase [Pseudomonadales bacterium]|nr:alpha/beta fold hydrolase [Pseudomonadales bacterium]MCP5185448.1 alpha/beta fold hydrolase [Pseudomonadales bacterium]
MSDAIRPFRIAIADAELDDLRQRLRDVRWPDRETPDDWSQGVPLAYAREFCTYWREGYDWRAREARLNAFPQFVTTIDGLDVHFIHARSPHDTARPIVITHGWPGSVVEFVKAIQPLTHPEAHGGSARDAFHVVCPSLPGYGFSGKPTAPGWGVDRIAAAWNTLMLRLGYPRYFAQGGDWGSAVTTAIGIQNLGACAGIHVNMPNARATREALKNPTPEDARALARAKEYQDWDSGYSKQQSTRPQSLGYGLADSPAGQAMWVLEKFWKWMDCNGQPENVLSRDELLDNIMLYWLTNSGASSARLYWESFGRAFGAGQENTVKLPAGCSLFPAEIVPTPRSWAQTRYTNLVYWNEVARGGHFAAFEQPDLFVAELRACFAVIDPR